MSYLNYDNAIAVGNNPYQQNRMVIDPRFRMTRGTRTDLSNIQGYSATGEVLLKGQTGISEQHSQHAQYAQYAQQTWVNARKPQCELSPYNQFKSNDTYQSYNLNNLRQATEPEQLPNWRQHVMFQQSNDLINQRELRHINEQRYKQILKL